MKASASATAFSAMSSAAACCCIWSMRTCEDAGKAYKTVRTELEAYEGDLADKPEIVALNKIDALTPDELKKQKDRLKRAAKKTPLLLSASRAKASKEALRALVDGDRRSPGSPRPRAARPSRGRRRRKADVSPDSALAPDTARCETCNNRFTRLHP